jgi:hypothetical protein
MFKINKLQQFQAAYPHITLLIDKLRALARRRVTARVSGKPDTAFIRS